MLKHVFDPIALPKEDFKVAMMYLMGLKGQKRTELHDKAAEIIENTVTTDKKDKQSAIERVKKTRAESIKKITEWSVFHKHTLKVIATALDLPVAVTRGFRTDEAASRGIPLSRLRIDLRLTARKHSYHGDIILFVQLKGIVLSLQNLLRDLGRRLGLHLLLLVHQVIELLFRHAFRNPQLSLSDSSPRSLPPPTLMNESKRVLRHFGRRR